MSETTSARDPFPRRSFLKWGAAGTAAVALGTSGKLIVPELRKRGLMTADGLFDAGSIAWADKVYVEAFPTSPLIVTPFNDPLPIPKALAAGGPEDVGGPAAGRCPPGTGAASRTRCRQHARSTRSGRAQIGYPDPIVYKINVEINTHSFTSSEVLPINSLGQPTVSFDAAGKTVSGRQAALLAERARSTGSTVRSRGR